MNQYPSEDIEDMNEADMVRHAGKEVSEYHDLDQNGENHPMEVYEIREERYIISEEEILDSLNIKELKKVDKEIDDKLKSIQEDLDKRSNTQ